MNCQEFWNQAPENWRPPSATFSAHLSECPACASAWARQQHMAAGLRQAAVDWSRLQAPARVESRLVSAFRAQAGLGGVRHSRPWIGALTWATAAVTVLVLAISLMHVRGPQTAAPKPSRDNIAILAALQEVPEGSGFETASLETGFVPLPNVEQLAPNEQGDLVTVELPRSSMIALGFEVSPERAAEPVQAEVMFGPDGVARAVRFLDETF
jgi:hypothetical protein